MIIVRMGKKQGGISWSRLVIGAVWGLVVGIAGGFGLRLGRSPLDDETLSAIAEAMPEQKTKISVASENPNRAGIQLAQVLFGIWAIRMMNIAMPR